MAIPPSEYDEEFGVASTNAFINDLKLIDNVILNNLANQNKAPYELIKKCAKNKGLLDANSNTQLTNEHSKHSTHGQLRSHNQIQSHLKIANKQSALSHSKFKTIQPVRKTVNLIHCQKMNRRPETRGFKGVFIPTELKSTDPKRQNTESTTQWQGSSDREESPPDPRWHKRPPAKGKKANTSSPKQSKTESASKVQDAREVFTQKKAEETRKKSNFPKIIFNDNKEERTNQTEQNKVKQTNQTEQITGQLETKSCQTETEFTSNSTQTKSSWEQKSDDEVWVSRVESTKTIQEERRHNKAPSTMTKNTSLEASHELITERLVARLEKVTNTTEAEENTRLFRKKLQRVLGVRITAAPTKKDRNLRPLINFVKKRDW